MTGKPKQTMSKTYIPSCLNYTGGKFRLLPQIEPLFPSDIHTFVDLFGGGFSVGLNATSVLTVYNDTLSPLKEMLHAMHSTELSRLLYIIDEIIRTYKLSKTNRNGYLELRARYNDTSRTYTYPTREMMLYMLMCHGFNNQIRFNSKGEFNMPFGKDRSEFNPTLRQKFIDMKRAMDDTTILFYNEHFTQLFKKLPIVFDSTLFVYMDPPYLGSDATYTENGGWSIEDERRLHVLCDTLTGMGVRWAMSNNLKYENPALTTWLSLRKDETFIHPIHHSCRNCSYQKRDKSPDKEVLITNYEVHGV